MNKYYLASLIALASVNLYSLSPDRNMHAYIQKAITKNPKILKISETVKKENNLQECDFELLFDAHFLLDKWNISNPIIILQTELCQTYAFYEPKIQQLFFVINKHYPLGYQLQDLLNISLYREVGHEDYCKYFLNLSHDDQQTIKEAKHEYEALLAEKNYREVLWKLKGHLDHLQQSNITWQIVSQFEGHLHETQLDLGIKLLKEHMMYKNITIQEILEPIANSWSIEAKKEFICYLS